MSLKNNSLKTRDYQRILRNYIKELDSNYLKSKQKYSVTNGTIFHNVRFTLLKAFRIVIEDYESGYTLSSSQVGRDYKIRQATAWSFLNKIRKRKTDVEKLMTFMNEPKKKKVHMIKDDFIKKIELIEKNIMKLKIN